MNTSFLHQVNGLDRDRGVNIQNQDKLYDALNIRITPTEDSQYFIISNEKGNLKLDFQFLGNYIGKAILNNYLIVFTEYNGENIIYRVDVKNNTTIELYKGNLQMSSDHPIETVSIYENENIQKVYWTDGVNQPRVINITTDSLKRSTWNNNSFDFVTNLKLEENVIIQSEFTANGAFQAGTIQYVLSYFNKYSQETNMFYISSVLPLSNEDRGGEVNSNVNISYKIIIDNPDQDFDFIRIYSIYRSSENSDPIVKKVMDLDTSNLQEIDLSKDENNPDSTSDKSYIRIDAGQFNELAEQEHMYLVDRTNNKITMQQVIDDKLLESEKYEYENYFHKTFIPGKLYNKLVIDDRINLGIIIPPETTLLELMGKDNNILVGFVDFKYENNNKLILLENEEDPELPEHIVKGVVYSDYNMGEIIESSSVLFIGGEQVTAETITQKDNTLFLGGITLKRETISKDIRDKVKTLNFKFFTQREKLEYDINTPAYKYDNTLKNLKKSHSYKYGEYYRIGIQLIHISGKISEPLFINDYLNSKRPTQEQQYVDLVRGWVTIPKELANIFYASGYRKVRGVIVFPNIKERNVIAQGVINPTVFNATDRINNSPSAISSWVFRPYMAVYSAQDELTQDYAEFRHHHPIPPNTYKNAEIQCLSGDIPLLLNNNPQTKKLEELTKSFGEAFYIDQSLFTLNSPDIETNPEAYSSVNLNNYSFRIVAIIPVTQSMLDTSIVTESLGEDNSIENVLSYSKINSNSRYETSVLNYAGYRDKMYKSKNDDYGPKIFTTYMWHREGSLNNSPKLKETTSTAKLKSKKVSSLKFSNEYTPLDTIINFKDFMKIEDAKLCFQDHNELIRLKSNKNSSGYINYQYNVDKIISPIMEDKTTTVRYIKGREQALTYNKKDGYPICIKDGPESILSTTHSIYDNYPLKVLDQSEINFSTDPCRIKYKSSPHVVLSIGTFPQSSQVSYNILPNFNLGGSSINNLNDQYTYKSDSGAIQQIKQPVIRINYDNPVNNSTGFLYIGEFYKENPNINQLFGGRSEEALQNNTWLPAGDFYIIKPNEEVKVLYTVSDTYFQRFDTLKTYMTDIDDLNSTTEILSFMCETRENVDGRYDRNRGKSDNLVMTPKNFNLINTTYNQKDNFFPNTYVNSEDFSLAHFPNTITWTKEKLMADQTDTWTNVTMANTLDMDGDKGDVTSLKVFNNEIYCFQNNGLSQILFNSRVQIQASDGLPIEIAQGQKVQGKRYISNMIGAQNKFSIVQSPSGLYFIDNNSKHLYLFNGQMTSITDQSGMRNWALNNLNGKKWTPNNDSIILHYDSKYRDVYIINNKYALCYSELLNTFTSFYDYQNTVSMFNINNNFYSLYDNSLWINHQGEYNNIYNKNREWYLEFLSNAYPTENKIFNTLEFRGTTIDENKQDLGIEPITYLSIRNDYQQSKVLFNMSASYINNLKRKFRVWRANIPRDNRNNRRTRISNTWSYIKIGNDRRDNNQVIINDMRTHFTI